MKISKNFALVLLSALALSACKQSTQSVEVVPVENVATASEITSNASIEQAFESKSSDVQVTGKGMVVKLLVDDTQGEQHQKFLVKINATQVLLFAHNIDLAARIPLKVGDEITFSGVYVYNPKGGVLHWTHHDPSGHHPAGWVILDGQKYQ